MSSNLRQDKDLCAAGMPAGVVCGTVKRAIR
jgi:hypothetical protein